ncbi:MAG: IS3 family transposase [Methylococcales bacterium]|nr:IS3 family transposase [Methylococcales bacterium]
MQVSTSAFYAWAQAPENTQKTRKNKAIESRAQQLFDENKKWYGSRRLSNALKKEGSAAGRYKVRRIMTK